MLAINGERIDEKHIYSYKCVNETVLSIKMDNGDIVPIIYSTLEQRNNAFTNLDLFMGVKTV
jgi:hypothetical protein